MINPSLNYMVQRTIYDLKRRYGNEITVYRLDSASTDYETGQKTASKTAYQIRSAVVLPASETRRFFASIAMLSAAKQFIAPGNQGFDQSRRGFIIEARDLPSDFEFQPEDWIVYNSRRYECEIIEALESRSGWMIMAKELKGTDPEEIISLNVNSSILFEEEANES